MDYRFRGIKHKKKKRTKRPKTSDNGKQEPTSVNNIHEVCLNDFANAADTRGALKKISKKMVLTSCSGSNSLSKLAEKLNQVVISTNEDDSPWFERDDIDDLDMEDFENEDEEEEDTIKCVECLPQVSQIQVFSQVGKSYPFDIWCLLSTYIKPEQIRTFSGICRAAYESVNSKRFWVCLYKRFVPDTTCLPARLKPDWIESRPGLKMRIVRALFIGYKNFRNRLQLEDIEGSRNTETVCQLIGLICCRVWYQSETKKSTYSFYFKFKLEHQKDSKKRFSFENEEYLTRNEESRFIILQINVANFIRLDSVCGETLTDISVNLSRNMRYNCVKLLFHSYRKDGKYRKEDGMRIILDPVSQIRLLHWWHPSYPHYDE